MGTTMKDINYALMLIAARRLEGARDLLEELRREDPGNRDILYNLGMCYTELDDTGSAVCVLSECLRYHPNDSNAHVALGFAHSRLAEDGKAKEHFLKALDLDPSNPYALRNLGGLYGKEGDYDRAVQCLERSLSINPSDQQTAYGLGYVYFQAGKIEQADRCLRAAVSLDGSTKIAALAKDLLREIAGIGLRAKGFRLDAVFHCLAALQHFRGKSAENVRRVAFEIGMMGRQGLDVNDPARKYSLNSMEGPFSGLQLVCYMYVGFKMIDPDLDIGIDLSGEYRQALDLFDEDNPHGHTIH